MLSSFPLRAAKNTMPTRVTPVSADQPIPAIDFARPPLFEDPQLSPSGTYFATFSKNERLENNVVICQFGTNKINVADAGVREFEWIDDSHLLLDHDVKRVIEITHPRKNFSIATVLPMEKRGLNSGTGFLWTWPVPYESGSLVTEAWHRLDDGKPLYKILRGNDRLSLFRQDGSHWVKCPIDLDEITPLEIGDRPDEMLVIGPRAPGLPRALQRLDTRTGQLGEVLYRDKVYDCAPPGVLKRDSRRLIGISVLGPTPHAVWFDDQMIEVQTLINRQFSGVRAEIVSTDVKHNRFLIKTESDRQPPIFYLLDYAAKSIGLIKNVSPWFDPARMAPTKVLSFKARDGATIEATLTLPAGATKQRPAPLVVDIHAGPWTTYYGWSFSDVAQFFADAGYAVLRINYRGSPGYDSRFDAADRFDFQKMSNDIIDGVRIVEQSGMVDRTRISIRGVGFGAYLGMCAVLDEPELFRCAILRGGIFDWEKQFKKKDSASNFSDLWIQRHLRSLGLSPPSPLQQKERIKIPLFFVRNLDVYDMTYDTQISEFYQSMKNRVPCENFGDLNIRTWDQAYDESVRELESVQTFLKKYMK